MNRCELFFFLFNSSILARIEKFQESGNGEKNRKQKIAKKIENKKRNKKGNQRQKKLEKKQKRARQNILKKATTQKSLKITIPLAYA